MPFDPVTAGIVGGSALLSGISQRNANARERRRFRRMIRRRRTSPEGQALTSAIERLRGLSETLPGQIRSNLRGQAVAQQQANLAKLNRSLAQKGYTSGSQVYGSAQRGAIGDLINQQQRAEIGTGQLQSQLLGNLGNLSLRAGQYFNPMSMGPQEQFIDPTNILGSALVGGLLGGRARGAGQNLTTNSRLLANYDNAMIPSGWNTANIGMSMPRGLPVLDVQEGDVF